MKTKNSRFKFLTILLISIIIIISGCQNIKATKLIIEKEPELKVGYPLTLTDSMGREITLENEPQRVISIAPNITETIFAIGAGEKLIARTDYCDYPKEISAIQSIGSLREPNIEKILELNPDLIIASTHFDTDVLKKLEELGLNVAVLYGEESFEGVYEIIDKTGKFLNADINAQKVINKMKLTVNKVTQAVKEQSKPETYYVVSFGEGGDYTATGETFVSQIIEMAGGENVAADTHGWKYNIEKLVEKNPEILICSKYSNTKENIMIANGYKELTAVKTGKIYEIDNNLIDRQGPRLAQGLEALAKILHPKQFKL